MRISIKNNMEYKDIEEAYSLFNDVHDIDLYIPADIDGKQLGIFPEIIQLIITWSRKCKNGKLYVNYESTTDQLEDKIDTMFRRYWNFVAGCMGYTKGIYLRDGNNIQNKVASTLKKRIEFIDSSGSWKKGNYEFIACVKHSLRPYPTSLYKNDELRSKGEFIELLEKILISVISVVDKSADVSSVKRNREIIGSIVYELIENTHFWSLTDDKNIEYPTAIRGIIVADHSGSRDTLLKNCRDDENLIKYINDLNVNSNMSIIEISIFDSGPGLAGRWKNKSINEFSTRGEIFEAIIDCFIFGNSSSKNEDYQRGFGYYNIMKLLKDTGYLTVRTNGLKLYRNFIETPFDPSDKLNRNNYQMFDWHLSQQIKPSNLSEGTVVSIFLPIIGK